MEFNKELIRFDYDVRNFDFIGAYEGTQEYIEDKLMSVRKIIGSYAKDEEINFKIDLYREETRDDEEKYFMKVVVHLPGGKVFESDVRGITPDYCIDKIEDKLKAQVEKFRRD